MVSYDEPPSQSNQQPTSWVGLLIIAIGLTSLFALVRFTRLNFPLIEYITPILLILGMLFAALHLQSILLSIIMAVLALFCSLTIVFGGNNALKEFMGIVIVLAALGLTINYFFIIPVRSRNK
jgi:hypothetical protein